MSLPVQSAPAQTDIPALVGELSGPTLGAVSFFSVLVVAVLWLARRGELVEEAVDRTIDGTPLALLHGLAAFGLVVFVGGYVLTQLTRLGLGGRTFSFAATVLIGVILVGLAGLGYLVIGAYLTQLESVRRSWVGAAVGATLSALPWLVLPPAAAAVLWMIVAAAGLGNQTRHWVHGERRLDPDQRG